MVKIINSMSKSKANQMLLPKKGIQLNLPISGVMMTTLPHGLSSARAAAAPLLQCSLIRYFFITFLPLSIKIVGMESTLSLWS